MEYNILIDSDIIPVKPCCLWFKLLDKSSAAFILKSYLAGKMLDGAIKIEVFCSVYTEPKNGPLQIIPSWPMEVKITAEVGSSNAHYRLFGE